MRKLIYTSFLIFIVSCSNVLKKSDDYTIYNTLVKKLAKYPEVFLDQDMKGIDIDSLNLERNKNLIVNIRTDFFEIEKSGKEKLSEDYLFLFEHQNIMSEDYFFDIEKIQTHNFRKIELINGKPNFDEIDIYLGFSRIVYNKEKNKAILEIVKSYGKLSGGKAYYLLSKINNNWEIVEIISKFIS